MNLPEQDTQPASPAYRTIPLTKGKVALVDAEDYTDLSRFKWQALVHPKAKTSYAVRSSPLVNGVRRYILMHRHICGVPKEVEIDHRDGDGLNNRRSSLREATSEQNSHNRGMSKNNTSGYKGVSLDKCRGTWAANICQGWRTKFLGRFPTAELASAAYIEAAKRLHGEFARWE